MKSRYNKASSKIARRRKKREKFFLFLKIAVPIIFSAGAIWLLRVDFLQVKDFEAVGNEVISTESLKNVALHFVSGNKFLFIPKTNILFLSKSDLSAVLLSDFSGIEKINANKEFFSRKIKLEIFERKEDFIWCSENNRCFSMTKDGLVFSSIAEILTGDNQDKSNKIIFRGILSGDPILKSFAPHQKMQGFKNLADSFTNAGFKAISINIESSEKGILKTIINNRESEIIFNPNAGDFSSVAENALLLIKEIRAKNAKAFFKYIDTRFGNKIFYKIY